ncbi:MAG: hypothetical protein BA871_07325 [Desulfuromonadales bacterium C00003096]|jgi:hypothetical protein|nr:MAG: hypothetical protein BA871_07325 [Desulfuromonadales bacterium C00003096]
MGKTTRNTVVKTLVVMVCISMLSLGLSIEGMASFIPDQERIISPGHTPFLEQRDLDPSISGIPESLKTKVFYMAKSDKNLEAQPNIAATPGGSVWDNALEGNLGGSGNGTEENKGDKKTGGRLVDPDRDVKYGDGTIGVDAL